VDSWPPAWLTPVKPESIARGDGDDAIEFAELFGSIGKDGIAGKAGQPLILRDWQKQLLKHLYARDANGGYEAQTALVGMPRKSGKSALSSAAVALYSLLAEGVQGGEVIVAAAEKEQARIVFGEAVWWNQANYLRWCRSIATLFMCQALTQFSRLYQPRLILKKVLTLTV
jgi:phage terminase large subunit-like protein